MWLICDIFKTYIKTKEVSMKKTEQTFDAEQTFDIEWDKKLKAVVLFDQKNNRWPSVYANNKKERDLADWLSHNQLLFSEGMLNLAKMEKFKNANLHISRVHHNIICIGRFKQLNGRVPVEGENLYPVYKSLTKYYENKSLTASERRAVIDYDLFDSKAHLSNLKRTKEMNDEEFLLNVKRMREYFKKHHGRLPMSQKSNGVLSEVVDNPERNLNSFINRNVAGFRKGNTGKIPNSNMTYEQRYNILRKNGLNLNEYVDGNMFDLVLRKGPFMRQILTLNGNDCYTEYAKTKQNVTQEKLDTANKMREADAEVAKTMSRNQKSNSKNFLRAFWKAVNNTDIEFLKLPKTRAIKEEPAKHYDGFNKSQLKFFRKQNLNLCDKQAEANSIMEFFRSQDSLINTK